MTNKTTLALAFGMMVLSWLQSLGWAAYENGPGPAWEQTDSFLRSPFVAAFDPSNRLYQPPMVPYPANVPPDASFLRSPFVAAFDPAPRLYQPPIYPYMPDIPPGMCRWERYVLDGYGRNILDQYGQPVKEYTIGPCRYPPN